jgi:hypothetical protein
MSTLWPARGGGDERLHLALQWQALWHGTGLPPCLSSGFLACLQGDPQTIAIHTPETDTQAWDCLDPSLMPSCQRPNQSDDPCRAGI